MFSVLIRPVGTLQFTSGRFATRVPIAIVIRDIVQSIRRSFGPHHDRFIPG